MPSENLIGPIDGDLQIRRMRKSRLFEFLNLIDYWL